MNEKTRYVLSMLFAGATVVAAWVGLGLITAHLVMVAS